MVKRFILAVLLTIGLVTPANSAPFGCGNKPWLVPFAFETLTVSTVSKALTASVYLSAHLAVVTIESNPLRYRLDGTDPTSAVGHLANASATAQISLPVCGNDSIKKIRFIRSGASDSTIMVSYYREIQ